MTAPPPPSAEQVAATTEPVPAVVHAVGVPGAFDDAVDDQEEDDFGDFGAETIPTATLPPTAVEDVSPNAVKLPASRGRGESDAGDEARVEKLVDTIGSDLDPAARTAFDLFGAALRDSISLCPVASEAAMATVTPMVRDEVEAPTTDGATAAGADSARASFKGRITLPNDAFSNTDWYNVWKHLSSEQSYTENVQSKFRWKRSHIRQMYLKALNVAAPDDASSPENSSAPKDGRIDVVAQPATSTSTEKSRETGEAAAVFHSQSGADAKDTRQAEIDEAKSYCNISEEELRKQTNEELVGLIKVLAMHQVKMQEQANFWLDAKEQLLMDAEMHNKMIASLVQYATQQHVGSPKGAPRSPQKHKKRTVGRPH
ncbi:hypothetical protein DFJ73DRAFT_857290 [Zopfochytrium polystomum]|nr:hypothetical protein DFJ73DRAFT_857290 [Zopfochytrium polystomum]